jgi:membrane associated rhomboid family serine protease
MNLTPAVKNIMIINVLIYLACFVVPGLSENLTGYYFASPNFRPWQIVTHMFMHSMSDFTHIFFNMYALYLFGTALENYWGTKRFLI